MADYRLEPVTELTRTVPAAPTPDAPGDDGFYHCPNCLFLKDPTGESGFWACQNLCIRE
jgi:hypothetical protein